MKHNDLKQPMQIGVAYFGLCLALILLAACRSQMKTIRIEAEVSPEPIVGEIATLHIDALSSQCSGDGLLSITPFNNINIIEGELEWRGNVKAGEPFVHELTFCITQPGNTGFYIQAGVGGKGIGQNQLHILSTADSAEVIASSEYRVRQPPQGSTPTPTPEPVPVSPECAGNNQTLAENKMHNDQNKLS